MGISVKHDVSYNARQPGTSTSLGMLRGSCLCGGVRYEITDPLSDALNCHCKMCRKAHGTAFRSRARISAADVRWIQGEELITYYESSPGNHRGFCRVCIPLLLAALTGIRLPVVFLSARSTMIRVSNQSFMSSSRTKRRGSTSPMIELPQKSSLMEEANDPR